MTSDPISETVAPSRVELRLGELSWRELDGQVIILNLRISQYQELNSTASALWQRLALGPASAEELTSALLESFDVAADVAADGVAAFVAQLQQSDLLED